MDLVATWSEARRREVFREAAARLGMTPAVVEKDFWVCWTLDRIFGDPDLRPMLLFKGGTSLSKAHLLIERFSEDIDLILDAGTIGGMAAVGPTSPRDARDQEAERIRMRTREYIAQALVPRVRALLGDRCVLLSLSDENAPLSTHPEAIRIAYPAAFEAGYLRPEILLEVSPLALWLPHGEFPISSHAAQAFPDLFTRASSQIPTVVAERTFWEKGTILHALAHLPDGRAVPSRHSRHAYDLARMIQSPIRERALARIELLREVADFKATFYAQSWARYDLARQPETLRVCPEGRVLGALARDYSSMREMIYGERPTFDEIVTDLRGLEAAIHALA